MTLFIKKYGVLILILTAITFRLPQLAEPFIYLDGDESIVGLMAKHYHEGLSTPYFFYGQNYGYSYFEVLFITTAYSFFGVTATAVKIGILSLWLIGVCFLYLFMKSAVGDKDSVFPFFIMLVLILSPAWMIWSMKARGGYVTAFTLSSLILYISYSDWLKNKWITQIFIGLLLVFIYQSQPLWLIGILPYILYSIINHFNYRKVVLLGVGLLLCILFFVYLKQDIGSFWNPDILSMDKLTIKKLTIFPELILSSLSGNFYYTNQYSPPISVLIWIFLFLLILVLLIFKQVLASIKTKRVSYMPSMALIATVGSLAVVLFTDVNAARYLLPFLGFALIYLLLIIHKLGDIRMKFLVTALIVLGCVTSFSFTNVNTDKKSDLKNLINLLEKENIDYAFSEKGLLQWQIMFYRQEKTICRFKYKHDRYPKYIHQVNKSLENNNRNTALIGLIDWNTPQQSHLESGSYFILKNPSKSVLIERGFEF